MSDIEIDVDAGEWDKELAAYSGHPWQSAYWGNTQHEIEGVPDRRIRLRKNGETVQMVRVEQRNVPSLGKMAWIRRGPTNAVADGMPELEPEIMRWLGQEGYCLAVSSPFSGQVARDEGADAAADPNVSRTIWVDLMLGTETLWQNLQRTFRSDVGRARKKGVTVETTRDPQLIADYCDLYQQLGETKGFEIRTSKEFILNVISRSQSDVAGAHLFLALFEGEIAAGAMICRCGGSLHYMNGVSNRKHSRLVPAVALHWAVMEWGVSRGCLRYDLEGIDARHNPGVYAFKKKMGGDEIVFPPRQVYPLNLTGQLIKPIAGYVLNSGKSGLQALASGLWTRRAAI